ncbi:MAG TPA: serine/threonine-protein kinase [Gemmatimonadaceae bacterium]|nr:serine/threonine-protein kinase [Gemmatimonadaceae bacterium]
MTQLRDQLQAHLSGSHKLGRELTGGGMSRVFVAEDTVLGRTVVVKVLAPELAAGLNAERFKREISLSAKLQHPHIVPILSSGVADGLPYFVMPFVIGESLRNRLLDEVGMPIPEAVTILRDVSKALAFAHAEGVVHRDIKPDNVLLAGGSAVVTDFGIAKAISSARVSAPGETLTQAGTSLGTPTYMSPEQAAGDPNADARSDFYSFGAMAYEMVAGRPPFHDRATHALIMAHIAEPPEPLERLVPSVPSPLAHLIMRCLSKNPADRPQSSKEILEDLDDLDLSAQRIRSGPRVAVPNTVQGIVTTPRTSSAGTNSGFDVSGTGSVSGRQDTGPHAYPDGTVLIETPYIPPRRKKARLAIIAGSVAVVLGLAVVFGKRLIDGRNAAALDARSLAVVPFRVASADRSLHYLREGMVDLIAAKLSGEDLRAMEPRVLLDAWRKAGGSERTDLSLDATLRLATQLNAGRALLGDVVGTPNRLVLTVSLLQVPKGNQISRVSVEGPPDSLASLVDQIAARILTETSGEGAARMSSLTSTSLSALRAYLDGQSRLRHGDAAGSAKDFAKALDLDSTFALAGLGLRLATAWYGDQQLSERGIRIAWRERQRLSDRDKHLLEALAGPKYPERSSTLELYQVRDRYLANDPSDAEGWYLLADHLFHYGGALGFADYEQRALTGFKRAMELDSTYLPGYTHAMPLAPSLGDLEFARRAERLMKAADTSEMRGLHTDWYMALYRNDTAAAKATLNRQVPNRETLLNGIIRHAMFDGIGAEFARTAILDIVRLSPTEQQRKGRARFAHDILLAMGRPNEALQFLAASADSASDSNIATLKVRDATLGEIDASVGEEGARQLAILQAAPDATDSAGRAVQRAVARVIEPWKLSRGDTTTTRRSLQRLRSHIRHVAPFDTLAAQVEIALIEAMLADATKSPRLRPAVERLDSLVMKMDFAPHHPGRLAQTAITGATMWEKLGEPKRALAMVLKRNVWANDALPYLGAQLREEARIAALAGDRARAIRSYRHFIRLRANPEPSRKAEVDAARRELAKLEAPGG